MPLKATTAEYSPAPFSYPSIEFLYIPPVKVKTNTVLAKTARLKQLDHLA